MMLKVAKPDDRDAMVVILARNGYTVRITKKKEGNRSMSYVEVIDDVK